MNQNIVCRSCGFSGNSKQYARHFRSSPACRGQLHEKVAAELTRGKSVADVGAKMGINRVTVYRIAREGKTKDKLFVGSSGPWGVEDVQQILLLLSGDAWVGRISRSQLASLAKAASNELRKIETELYTSRLEARELRLQMRDLQMAKAKTEEELHRALKAHNSLITNGKISETNAQEKVRIALAEMGL